MTRFDYYHNTEFLLSEYPDTNKPDFKISLDIRKTFYKDRAGWNTEYTFQSLKTLELKLKMESIKDKVVTYRSYDTLRNHHIADEYEGW